MDDSELLTEYARTRSEESFATLVWRYVDLVYSSARRQVEDSHLAEDVTQAVFILLAQKAGSLAKSAPLPAWLLKTTHFVARDAVKLRGRRQHHEQQAAAMRHETERNADDPAWESYAALVDGAMARLRDADRSAVALRYLRGMSLREVGQALGLTEEAARKRVDRAVARLQALIGRKAVAPGVAGLAGAMAAKGAEAAPAGLAATAIAASMNIGGTTAATMLAKATGKLMIWTKLKVAAAALGAFLAAGGVITVVAETGATRPSAAPTPAVAAPSKSTGWTPPLVDRKQAAQSPIATQTVSILGFVPQSGQYALSPLDGSPNLRAMLLITGLDLPETGEGQELQIIRDKKIINRLPARPLIESGIGDMVLANKDVVLVTVGEGGSDPIMCSWLSVHDMNAEVAFYRDMLGCQIIKPLGVADLSTQKRVVLQRDGSRLILRSWPHRGSGADLQVKDVRSFRAALARRGMVTSEIRSIADVYPRQLACDGTDPEGNTFGLIQYMEGPATTRATR